MGGACYVYALVDPRDGSTFYVGKGRGRRMYDHENEAKRQDRYIINAAKRARIDAILAAGLRVEHRVLSEYPNDQAAFAAESRTIAALRGLTNRNRGRRATEPTATPEATLGATAQMLAHELATTLAWAPHTKEAIRVREEHIEILNRAIRLVGVLAAEVAASTRH